MGDKELLELAAKAAGLKIDKSYYSGGGFDNTGFDLMGNLVLDWYNNKIWNPIKNDGDALRLAVKLGINITIDLNWKGSIAEFPRDNISCFELFKNDPHEAVRRAIVRVAAEIGKSLI